MPGRYGRSARSHQERSSARTRASLRFRLLGLLAGTAVVAAGVMAINGGPGAEAGDHYEVSSDADVTGDAPDRLRDSDNVSRSDTRRPGRHAHVLPASAIRSVSGGDTGPDDGSGSDGGSGSAKTGSEETTDDTGRERPETPKPSSSPPTEETVDPDAKPAANAPLPSDSGSGRRVVFDITQQQVWLVEDGGTVARTYLVSGSRYDQLPEGSYEVFSKSKEAVSWTLEETMRYMVRFHRGENSNIGFHDIPVYEDSGDEVQTLSELGTALSDGCIRQDHEDAKALWDFAPVGTTVEVVRT